MDIEYQITLDDLYAFQWRAVYRTAAGRRARRHVYGTLLLLFLVIAIVPSISPDGIDFAWINWLLVAVVFPISAGAYWLLERWQMRRAIRAYVRREHPEKGQIGRHRLVLDDEFVTESTAVGETRTAWEGIDRVEQDDDYIFIYTSPSAAHVVPKRIFTGTQAEEFFQEASRLASRAAT